MCRLRKRPQASNPLNRSIHATADGGNERAAFPALALHGFFRVDFAVVRRLMGQARGREILISPEDHQLKSPGIVRGFFLFVFRDDFQPAHIGLLARPRLSVRV